MEETILTQQEVQPQAETVQKRKARKPSPAPTITESQSPSEMSIFEQLFYIQQRLKVGKTEKNESEGFPYRSEEAILAAVTPLLGDMHCILYFRDEIVDICPNYVYLKTTCVLANSFGEVIEIPGFARSDAFLPGRCQAQIDGAASTYAHKYALKSLFGLAGENVKAERDPDAEPRQPEVLEPSQTPQEAPSQQKTEQTPSPAGLAKDDADTRPLINPLSRNWNKVVMQVARQTGRHTRQQYAEWIRKTYSINDADLDLLLKQAGKAE